MTLAEELERLHQLHQTGALTDEEFVAAKARLLAGEESAKPPPLSGFRLRERLSDGRFWGMLLHLSLLLNFAMPGVALVLTFLIWQIGKDRFPELDEHGKNAANFVISYGIYGAVLAVASLVSLIGPVLFPLVLYLFGGAAGLLTLIAAWQANQGHAWRYPLCFTFLQ